MRAQQTTASASDRELVLTRTIHAPREKVFRAWTDPDLLKQWFAPLPYTTPAAQMDVRPGGSSRIVMRAPDGTEDENVFDIEQGVAISLFVKRHDLERGVWRGDLYFWPNQLPTLNEVFVGRITPQLP